MVLSLMLFIGLGKRLDRVAVERPSWKASANLTLSSLTLSFLACLRYYIYLWSRSWAMEVELDIHAELVCCLVVLHWSQATHSCSWRSCAPVACGGPPGGQKCDLHLTLHTGLRKRNYQAAACSLATFVLCLICHNHTFYTTLLAPLHSAAAFSILLASFPGLPRFRSLVIHGGGRVRKMGKAWSHPSREWCQVDAMWTW